MPKKVLVLGGGIGGYVVARELAKKQGPSGDISVQVVEKEGYHYMPPLFFDVALGYADPESTRADVRSIEGGAVSVLVDEAVAIDQKNRKVTTKQGKTLDYDYLVVALGTDQGWSDYPGLAEEGHHNFTLEGAQKLREALKGVKDGQNITIAVPELPYRCGIYPYEAATVLSTFFRSRGMNVSVRLLDPMPSPVAPLGPSISSFMRDELERLGVEYVPNSVFQSVNRDGKKVVTKGGDYKYDLLIKVPPPRLPDVLKKNEEFVWKKDMRWTPVMPTGRHPTYDDVYLVGEHALPPLGIGLAGVFVESLAITAADNLLGDAVGGFGPSFMPSPVTCVGYAGDSGFLGTCELPFNRSSGVYSMACYFAGKFAIGRLLKQAFYHGWIDGYRAGGV